VFSKLAVKLKGELRVTCVAETENEVITTLATVAGTTTVVVIVFEAASARPRSRDKVKNNARCGPNRMVMDKKRMLKALSILSKRATSLALSRSGAADYANERKVAS
jgi:hypothetical protein